MTELKLGQYTEYDGDFRHRYIVHKIMPKTVEVGVGISWKYADWKYTRHYRYPKDLLIKQIQNAEYLPFIDDKQANYATYLRKTAEKCGPGTEGQLLIIADLIEQGQPLGVSDMDFLTNL